MLEVSFFFCSAPLVRATAPTDGKDIPPPPSPLHSFYLFRPPLFAPRCRVTDRPADTATGENKDVIDGIGSAGGSLARGLSDGVSGLIKNPIRGAERGGFTGFAKGVGTGMLGLVVKPVVGVTDAATDLLQGAARCGTVRACANELFFFFFFQSERVVLESCLRPAYSPPKSFGSTRHRRRLDHGDEKRLAHHQDRKQPSRSTSPLFHPPSTFFSGLIYEL